jgi:hypothetical protein
MNSRNTVIRSMHDVGAAGWFGGSLMGAIALNGASQDIKDPAERSKIAADGWARWAPFSAAAIGAQQGEQQRPGQQIRGWRKSVA